MADFSLGYRSLGIEDILIMIDAERQQSWGWTAAIYLFFAGVGGGVFLFSFILDFIGKYEPVARIGALSGPVLVGVGSLFLLFDLGSVTRAYRLFSSASGLLTSWMGRGAWILAAFMISGLAYSLPSFSLFGWLPWTRTSALGQGMGFFAALLSMGVAVYPGFLLGVLRSIPFWNASALPPLFFLSGLDTGIAVLALLALFFPASFDSEGFHLLGAGDTVLLFLMLIILGAYIDIVRQGDEAAAASFRLLRTPLFIGGAIILGLLLPLGLLLYSFFVNDALTLRILAGTTSALLLAGGFCLRYSVIRGGVRISVR